MQNDQQSLIEESFEAAVDTRLLQLLASPKTTVLEFPPFLTKHLRNYVHKIAASKGLMSKTCQQHGVKYVQVYKGRCYGQVRLAPTYQLTELSRKIVFHYLKQELALNDSNTSEYSRQNKVRIGPIGKSKVPIYRFCAGTINEDALMPPPRSLNKYMDGIRMATALYKYKGTIIEAVSKSQVTILCSDSPRGRATEVPQFLLEDHSNRSEGCRIICAVAHKATAVYNSEVVSEQRGERLGLTVGYQIQLESLSSMSTNLLYTTCNFFLRCLMGSGLDAFSPITHIVIEDISENHAFGDIFLHEIHEVLPSCPHLKVVLMCSKIEIEKLQSYFPNALLIDMNINPVEVKVYHLDEIRNLIAMNSASKSKCYKSLVGESFVNVELIDEVLMRCMNNNADAFELFVDLVKECEVDINAQHTETKITFGIAAARVNKLNYLMEFVNLGGDIQHIDIQNKSAFAWAKEAQNESCFQFLRKQLASASEIHCGGSHKNSEIATGWLEEDRQMVFKLIYYIHSTMEHGSILVLLPSFQDIVQQEFLLKQQIADGSLPSNISFYLLHDYTQIADYRLLFEAERPDSRKVIFCTSLPMSSVAINGLVFIIDSGLRSNKFSKSLQGDQSNSICWISQNCANRRALVAADDCKSYCFRLYTKAQFESMSLYDAPELNEMPLENICLYAKLLAPHLLVKEYLSKVRKDINLKRVDQSVELLQKIGAFDEIESITSLGIRLVDIPIDVQLAKVLVFGIVLQCLDPVLTIVSMLSYQQPSIFLSNATKEKFSELICDKNCLMGGSDHLFLLRVYQNWIEQFDSNETLLTESNYVVNAELEIVSVIRSQLIGILRATGLIQSSGTMNIHFINQRANNWPLVKASFVAGMYPNICRVFHISNELKLKNFEAANFHEDSVLKESILNAFDADWLFYHTSNYDNSNNVKVICNTLITPVSLALFAGPDWMSYGEVVPLNDEESDSESESFDSLSKSKMSRFDIDDWLSFTLSNEDAYLLIEMREKFYYLLSDIVRVTDDPDKFRKTKNILGHKFNVVEAIGNLLDHEEQTNNLPEVKRVGERPNAFSSKFTKFQNKIQTLKKSMMDPAKCESTYISQDPCNLTSKTTYFIKLLTAKEAEYCLAKKPLVTDDPAWKKIIMHYHQFPAYNPVIFLLLSDLDIFCGATQFCFDGEKYYLNEISSRNIPLSEISSISLKIGQYISSECYDGQELKFDIGKCLHDLFL